MGFRRVEARIHTLSMFKLVVISLFLGLGCNGARSQAALISGSAESSHPVKALVAIKLVSTQRIHDNSEYGYTGFITHGGKRFSLQSTRKLSSRIDF